jgi:hypothetical protein
MSNTQTLHFWTTGDDFTRLVRTFIEEGKVTSAFEILQDGGLPIGYIEKFFSGEIKFEGFRYQASKVRGDIVLGKSSDLEISKSQLEELKKIGETLYEDLNTPIQVEFVVSSDTVWIVQLRTFRNNPDSHYTTEAPKESLVTGLSFSNGYLYEVDVLDILVVEEDADSNELIGKKALIVKAKTEFSHVLALSKMLGIPSIYGVSKFELPNSGKVEFCSKSKNG